MICVRKSSFALLHLTSESWEHFPADGQEDMDGAMDDMFQAEGEEGQIDDVVSQVQRCRRRSCRSCE